MGAIRYYLQSNPITTDPNDQTARIEASGTVDTKGLVALMLKRGTSLTQGDIEGCMTLFTEVVTDVVADGYFVNLPFCNIRPSIKGVFNSPADSFDKARHIKKATLSPGLALSKKLAEAKVEKTSKSLPSPDVQAFEDVNADSINSILTPGGIGKVEGSELKFDASLPADGVFFVDATGNATKATVYALVTEGRIMFMVPALPAGEYTLEVRRSYTQNNSVRVGQLQDTLSVPEA